MNIKNLDKIELFRRLYNLAQTQNRAPDGTAVKLLNTRAEAEELLRKHRFKYADTPILVDLNPDEIDPAIFNSVYGVGSFEKCIAELQNAPPAESKADSDNVVYAKPSNQQDSKRSSERTSVVAPDSKSRQETGPQVGSNTQAAKTETKAQVENNSQVAKPENKLNQQVIHIPKTNEKLHLKLYNRELYLEQQIKKIGDEQTPEANQKREALQNELNTINRANAISKKIMKNEFVDERDTYVLSNLSKYMTQNAGEHSDTAETIKLLLNALNDQKEELTLARTISNQKVTNLPSAAEKLLEKLNKRKNYCNEKIKSIGADKSPEALKERDNIQKELDSYTLAAEAIKKVIENDTLNERDIYVLSNLKRYIEDNAGQHFGTAVMITTLLDAIKPTAQVKDMPQVKDTPQIKDNPQVNDAPQVKDIPQIVERLLEQLTERLAYCKQQISKISAQSTSEIQQKNVKIQDEINSLEFCRPMLLGITKNEPVKSQNIYVMKNLITTMLGNSGEHLDAAESLRKLVDVLESSAKLNTSTNNEVKTKVEDSMDARTKPKL